MAVVVVCLAIMMVTQQRVGHGLLLDQGANRRQMLAGTASGVFALRLGERRVQAADTAAETIRKAASGIPGLGPADVLFPLKFRGRWLLRRRLTSKTMPLGETAAGQVQDIIRQAKIEEYEVRFLDYGDAEHVVADRGWNAEHRFATKALWDPSNPNVLSIDQADAILEVKVTKRSFEQPSSSTFGSSEFARLALAPQGGTLSAVPQIFAQRTQQRWRWEDASPSTTENDQNEEIIDGIELLSVYDPSSTGFSDLAGATPVLTLKSSLQLSRQRK